MGVLNSDDKFTMFINKGAKGFTKDELIEPKNKQREQPARTIEQSLLTLLNTGQMSAKSMIAAIESVPSPNTNTPPAVGNVNHTQIESQQVHEPDILKKFDTDGPDKTNKRNESRQSPAKANNPLTESNSTSFGWIKVHRKSLENGWLRNHKLWTFWTYCLLKASHKGHTVIVGNQKVKLNPGQFVFGRFGTAKDLGMSEGSVVRCLENLKKMENVITKPNNKFTVITICNWETYQTAESSDRSTTDHQPITYKNEKKEKKKESGDLVEIPIGLQNEPFLQSWEVFKTHRLKMKRPMNFIAEQTMLSKLKEHSAEVAAEMLDRAVVGGYVDTMPPKPKIVTQAAMNQGGGMNGVVL